MAFVAGVGRLGGGWPLERAFADMIGTSVQSHILVGGREETYLWKHWLGGCLCCLCLMSTAERALWDFSRATLGGAVVGVGWLQPRRRKHSRHLFGPSHVSYGSGVHAQA